jgi:DNA-binding helix-hairpin-helix protein with protein kinase domain
VVRTPNHDAFGLAVLIFQMLCLGRHPFSGRFLGAEEQPSIEDAIRQYRYAYGGDARVSLMAPPPASLPMDALTPQVRQLFEKAFLRGSEQGTRPSPSQWTDVLTDLEGKLRQCSFNAGHYYLGTLPACPWCEVEAKSGTTLFPVVFVSGAGGADGFMLLWQQVEATQLPGSRLPMRDPPKTTPSAEAKAAGRRVRATWLTAGAGLLGGWGWLQLHDVPWQSDANLAWPFVLAAVLLLASGILRQRFRRKLKLRRAEWNGLRREWAAPSPRDPGAIRAGLETIRKNYDALQADRAAKLRKLHEDRRAHQLREYLDRIQIAGAKIKGVGPAKAATLQSYSIETAADVVFSSIVAVPGFGPKTAQNLVDWRANLERSFRFDPRRAVPQAEIDRVENAVAVGRRQLQQQLTAGLADLRSAIADEKAVRERLQTKFAAVAPAYAQALADCRAASVLGVR